MIAIRLAFKNLLGAGLRTWLNAGVLSFAFFLIIFYNGLFEGWNVQAKHDTEAWEVGKGELWHPDFDPLDVYTYQDAHAPISPEIHNLIKKDELTPILYSQASVYPEGRMMTVLLKGIDPEQKILELPTKELEATSDFLPAIIGKRMARAMKTEKGKTLLVRWRDKNGTFDAREVKIVDVFETIVPTVDGGIIWLPLDKLQKMTGMQNEATIFVAGNSYPGGDIENWKFKDQNYLFKDIDMLIKSKKGGSSLLWGLILILALLAIFDTQVLSIFRRQKEIGTYIALGMTRWQVVRIFTVEGTAYSIFAAILTTIYGTPVFYYLANKGFPLPMGDADIGIAMSDVIYPYFSLGLIVSTVLLVILTATIVSFIPARKIARLKPTEALKGKIQ
ncbi:ABC transporter permease [Saccharicrinis sp. FJH2]|uniref:ABC transporter permease n=1 Tax=Saccharicrinis sp. FJH65 TaxID=3344659 RepID=UPI0035F2C90B